MNLPVVVIGGGMAGLAAAVVCQKQGWQTVLVEKNRTPGGRTRSFALPAKPFAVDNGQHLLLAGYTQTRRLLAKLGVAHKVHYQRGLQVTYLIPGWGLWSLKALPLPAPFHLLLPLMLGRPLSLRSRIQLLSLAGWVSKPAAPLTVSQWLQLSRQTSQLVHWFWAPLTLSTINTPPAQASAELLLAVLRQGFLKSFRASGLGFPQALLQSLLVEPAVRFLQSRGATLLTGRRAVALTPEETGHVTVRLQNGRRITARGVIVALPPSETLALLKTHLPDLRVVAEQETSPIVTVNFWLRTPLAVPLPLAFVEGPFHWLLPLPPDSAPPGLVGYSLVASAAFQLARLPKDHIWQRCLHFLQHLPLKAFWHLEFVDHQVVKQPRATLVQSPRFVRFRATANTPLPGLYLAGDWIQTGLPQTIESAVRSGILAAQALHQHLQSRMPRATETCIF